MASVGAAHSAGGHAVVMRRYGPPDVLVYEELVLPALAPDEVRIHAIASAVNHSDLEIDAGNWPVQRADPFPYVPGYSSESLDGPVRRAVAVLADWLRRGLLRPPSRRVLPLSDAASAHATLERGGGRGRILLVPS
jgi:NADPH:quinone reductase-like Zn-dependent oxidoreductase